MAFQCQPFVVILDSQKSIFATCDTKPSTDLHEFRSRGQSLDWPDNLFLCADWCGSRHGVRDVYTQNRRLWVQLHEKGGKQHEMPCHHTLEAYLEDYMDAGGLRDHPRSPLFRTIARGTRELSETPLPQANVYAMIQRRAKAAGIDTEMCCHTFRVTGITACLKNGGTLERAAYMANHSSTRTTQLYDRRSDDISLDEVE